MFPILLKSGIGNHLTIILAMKFKFIIDSIQEGKTVRRSCWGLNSFIVKQIPQTISPDIVPKMTSLPSMAKEHIHESIIDSTEPGGGSISYHDQVIIITINPITGDADATYYIPTWEDIFAEDWQIILPN